jgi:hypothetical protein
MIILDELVRRSQLNSDAVAMVMSKNDQFFSLLSTDPTASKLCQLLLDRSFDFVRGTLLHRRIFGGELMNLEDGADLTAAEQPAVEEMEENVTDIATKENHAIDITDEEEEGDGRSHRRKREWNQENDEEEKDSKRPRIHVDQLWAADEAVKQAVRSCRAVFKIFMELFVGYLGEVSQNPSLENERMKDFLLSWLSQTWRAFYGFQLQISSQVSQRVIITEKLSEEQLAVLRSFCPDLFQSWKQFFH